MSDGTEHLKEGNHELMIVASKQDRNNSLRVKECENNNIAKFIEAVSHLFHSKDIFHLVPLKHRRVDPYV